MTFEELKDKALSLPFAPGVYLMRDAGNKVIYVGKAKKLKNRVSQYFQDSAAHTPKTRAMVSKIDHFDVIVAASEFEALVLECSLDVYKRQVFELRAACLAGYTPDLEGCRSCGNPEPDRFDLEGGCLECAHCRSGDGTFMAVTPGILAAMRHVAACPASRLFSFCLGEETLRAFGSLTERYLSTQLERGFSTLDFYKSLFPVRDA